MTFSRNILSNNFFIDFVNNICYNKFAIKFKLLRGDKLAKYKKIS